MAEQPSVTDLPEKLFYRIHEVSKLTGLEAHVLRYWESVFDELTPEKDAHKQRRYRKKDLELILQIKELLYKHRYTIAGAKEKLRQQRSAGANQPSSNSSQLIKKSNQILKTLTKLRQDLSNLLRQLEEPSGKK